MSCLHVFCQIGRSCQYELDREQKLGHCENVIGHVEDTERIQEPPCILGRESQTKCLPPRCLKKTTGDGFSQQPHWLLYEEGVARKSILRILFRIYDHKHLPSIFWLLGGP